MKTPRPAPPTSTTTTPRAEAATAARRDLRGATFAEGEAALAPRDRKDLRAWIARGAISVHDPSKPVTGLMVDARGLMPVSQGADHGWTGIRLATLRVDPHMKREQDERMRNLDIVGAMRMTPRFIVDELVEVERLCKADELGDNPARVRAKGSDEKGHAAFVYLLDEQLAAVREADRHLGSGFVAAGRVAIDWGEDL